MGNSFEISFLSHAVFGPGYQNAERHYRLESTAELPGAEQWEPVPGFADRTVVSSSKTLFFSMSPVPIKAEFFRGRVWLQQKP